MKKLLSLLITISLAAAATLSASAASAGTNVTFGSGPVKMSPITINSFGYIELTGLDQTAQTNINDFTITDPRGSGKGWNLQVSAARFQNGANLLHDGALSITDTKGVAVGRSDSFDPSYISGSFNITEVPGNFISVPQTKGKGTYTFSGSKLNLDIWPSEVLAGTYTTTITFDIVHNIG